MFPDGEDFFVRSVRHFRDQITDPELKRQVAGFIGQEAMHGREHRALQRPPRRARLPDQARRALHQVGPRHPRAASLPPTSNLAATAALEHFTATLAELRAHRARRRATLFGHDEVRNLFLWHALEESEHKAVAFDVYKAVGGTERMRVWTMNFLRFGFVVGMAVQVVVSLLGDRATYRPRQPAPQLAHVPPLADRAARSCGTSCATTTGPTSTPTTATPPSSSSSGAPSCSATSGTLNDKLATAAA